MELKVGRLCPTREEDISACLAIYNTYIQNTTITFEEEPLSMPVFTARVHRITEQYPFFLAKSGEKVLGYAYLDRYHERSAYRCTADLSVYLAQDARGHGAGTRLYEAIEKAGRAMGLHSIVSIVTGENTGSMRFHEKMGFCRVGKIAEAGLKFGRRLDVFFYQKLL